MKAQNTLLLIGASLLGLTSTSFAQAGGDPTNPPPGLPGKVMKTLDEVEARIPLVDGAPGVTTNAGGGFTISFSGSYYLVDNIVVSDIESPGIRISASRIKIDLNGYTIDGAVTNTSDAIIINSNQTNIAIENGGIEGFSSHITGTTNSNLHISEIQSKDATGDALSFDRLVNSSIDNVQIKNAGVAGIRLEASKGNRIANCLIESVNYGIYIKGTSVGASEGNRISECVINNTSSDGIWLQATSSGVPGNVVKECAIQYTGGSGITIERSGGGSAVSSEATKGNVLIHNTITNVNGSMSAEGIQLLNTSGCHIVGNIVSGVFTSSGSAYGIVEYGAGTDNLIVQNTVRDAADGFNFAGGTYGPVVTGSGAISSTNPWANFEL